MSLKSINESTFDGLFNKISKNFKDEPQKGIVKVLNLVGFISPVASVLSILAYIFLVDSIKEDEKRDLNQGLITWGMFLLFGFSLNLIMLPFISINTKSLYFITNVILYFSYSFLVIQYLIGGYFLINLIRFIKGKGQILIFSMDGYFSPCNKLINLKNQIINENT